MAEAETKRLWLYEDGDEHWGFRSRDEEREFFCIGCERAAALPDGLAEAVRDMGRLVARYADALAATAESRDHYMAVNGLVGLIRLYASRGDETAVKLAEAADIEAWVARANKLDVSSSAFNIKLREALNPEQQDTTEGK